MNRALATSIAALPFALAFGLYATGTLERIDNAIDQRRWGPKPPPPGPTRPLESYGGWWQCGIVPNFGKEWVCRIIVRTEGKRAWLRMWHYCETKYCEQGEFEAVVHGRPPASVYALEVVRRKSKDVFWTVTLTPNGNDPNSLGIIDSRLARNPQKNPYDNQSHATALKRVK